MPTSVYFNNAGASREQMLLEDMVIESIRNHGIDIYYIPRESQSEIDPLFGDDPVKAFYKAYPIDMYLETFTDFEGNQEFFSKFGLQVEKTARVTLARRTFERFVPSTLRNAPKEGDLIFMPTMQKLMEIKFVEQERNFFQLGRGSTRGGNKLSGAYEELGKVFPYMYGLSLELFKYNGEILDTGIPDIDAVQDIEAYAVDFTMQAGGSGNFNRYEVVYQGASLNTATARAYCAVWDAPNRILKLRNIKGNFLSNTLTKGATSTSSWFTQSFNTMENANDPYEDNMLIETEGDNILDWSETNPFGTANET